MFRKKPKNQLRRIPSSGQSANAFSYYSSRSRTDTPVGRQQEQPKRKNPSWWRHIPSLVAFVALVICAGYSLSLDTNPKVRLFQNSGDSFIMHDLNIYQNAAQELMDSSWLNRTKLTINTSSLENKFKTRFPELTDVSVIIPLSSRRPIFEIMTAKPSVVMVARNGIFVIGDKGQAMIKLSDVPKRTNLNAPSVTDESDLRVEVGKGALPTPTIVFITELVEQLKAKNISITSMTLPAIANELHARIGGQAYFIKFDLEGSAREQAGTYLAVKQKLEADHIMATEYIDVRVDGRAYYK